MYRRLFLEKVGVAGLAIPFLSSYLFSNGSPAESIREAAASNVRRFSGGRVKIGIIGTGHRGRQLAKLLASSPQVAIQYLCDPDRKALSRAVQTATRGSGEPGFTTNYSKLLTPRLLDAVVVATPSCLLAEITKQACDAGVWVYAETPEPGDSATARLLQEYGRTYGQQIQLGWQRRSAPTLEQAARDVRNGLIGQIQQISIAHTYAPETTSGEELLHLAQQDIDLSGFMAGLELYGDKKILFGASSSTGFGSCSARFTHNTVEVTWQGLARYGGASNQLSRTIRLFGSKGVLQTAVDGLSYQMVDYAGRNIRKMTAEAMSDGELTRLHLLRFINRVQA